MATKDKGKGKPKVTKGAKASKPKAAPKAKPEAKKKAPAVAAPKYTINDLATKVDRPAPSVRDSLRREKVEKHASGVYGWDSVSDMDKVVVALKERNKRSPEMRKNPKPDKPAAPAGTKRVRKSRKNTKTDTE